MVKEDEIKELTADDKPEMGASYYTTFTQLRLYTALFVITIFVNKVIYYADMNNLCKHLQHQYMYVSVSIHVVIL